MRHCGNCQKFQNDTCTEDGCFAVAGGTCERWQYHYEPLVFAVQRMRRLQKLKSPTRIQAEDRRECEAYVDRMIESLENRGELE